MTVFNVGPQTAAVINNVGGDQHNTGGQHVGPVTVPDARGAVEALRAALATVPLPGPTAAAAEAGVAEVASALQEDAPDRPRVAGVLERLTRLLAGAGALATGGAALVGPIQAIAGWLGSLGDGVLALLSRV